MNFVGRLGVTALLIIAGPVAAAGMDPTPARRSNEGAGPYSTLVIRSVTIITGNGGPPFGPADIVIKGNRIAEIRSAGTPGLAMAANRLPAGAAREIDATDMFVLPGFVDMQGHSGDPDKATDPSHPYRLWLAHGVTTVRGVSFFGSDVAHALDDKRRSAEGTITAPHLFVYQRLGSGWDGGRVQSPEAARRWVLWAAKAGVDGIKFFNKGNPLQNFKTLYGTRFARLNEATQATIQVGGVRWTIKDGIVFDAPALLKLVADQVAAAKAAAPK